MLLNLQSHGKADLTVKFVSDRLKRALPNVLLKDIDSDKGTLVVRGFKGHSSRVFKLKDDTLAILKD